VAAPYDPKEWGAAVYEDGYTISTTIAGERGLHPPCSFTYRPALDEERIQVKLEAGRAMDGKGTVAAIVKHIGRHVTAWDIKTGNGRDVSPTDEETVRRLNPELMVKILDTVNSYRPRDEARDLKNS
jgi:hypothetical protein